MSKYAKQFKEEAVRLAKEGRDQKGSTATGDPVLYTSRLAKDAKPV